MKTVNTNVTIVKVKEIIVPSVLMSEWKNHTVTAQKVSMMMVITQNVTLVISNVSHVTILTNVLNVKATDNNSHHPVHVQKDNTTVVKVNVVTVMSNVTLVTIMLTTV